MHLCFIVFYFHIVLNSIEAGNFLVSYFLLMFVNCRDRFVYWRYLYFLSYVVPTYFVGEAAKKLCQNFREKFSKARKNSKKSKVSWK